MGETTRAGLEYMYSGVNNVISHVGNKVDDTLKTAKLKLAIQTMNIELMNNIYHLILVIDQMTSLGSQNKTFISQLDSWRVTGPDGPREILESGFNSDPNNNFYKCLMDYCIKKKENSVFGKYAKGVNYYYKFNSKYTHKINEWYGCY